MAIAEAEIPLLTEAQLKMGVPMTEAEFMSLPKDGYRESHKFELVDGRLIGPFIRGHGAGTTGQAGFRMAGGNIRVPDVSFTRTSRLPGGKVPNDFGNVAPDLCIEIISPSEERADMARKVREYFDGGAEQVWHVFPETQQVTVFAAPTETQIFGADDLLDAGDILPGFSCRVGEIFRTE